MNKKLTAIIAVSFLAACASPQIKPAEVNPTDMPKGPGLFSGKSGNILDAFRANNGGSTATGRIGVNAYLWRASLDTISFMPITQADSAGGVITTDWYTNPEKPNERVRASVLILGKTLRADALKVTLFKQNKSKTGTWVDAPADIGTNRELEDIILTKARSLKVAAQANGQ
ncbi:MAG TPA: DUF3576 domain-containing protein [Alphaproteobacteria bacterium]|nr:DUF3576 domain-containing protein [Alphaproteobacteria bacterium]